VTRVAILCAGRGSYTERSLGSLPPEHEWVKRAEHLRRGYGLPSLVELDGAPRFESTTHLAPANVSPLIWLVSMLDSEQAKQEHEVTCLAGNSMGWYTALAVSGALSFDDGYRLVQEMSILQQKHQETHGGGQILYPLVGDDWTLDAERIGAVEDALASSNGQAFPSIQLGGYTVLAGTEDGIKHLLRSLPRVQLGKNPYPFRLMQHGAYHTQLQEPVALAARSKLAELEFRTPNVTLIDGLGRRFTPWSTDPDELRAYTLGDQIVAPYDLTLSVRVALREHAPDRIVCPGPGNTLGGVCGQILIEEGWRDVRSRTDFDALQASEEPIVVSMRR
jgi:malonyl CoA-acyl carrier protein transacylase